MQATMAGKTSGNCYFGRQLGDFEVLHTLELFVGSKIFTAFFSNVAGVRN